MESRLKTRWQKLGQVYVPNGEYSWAKTHAFLPTPYLLDERTIRIYCSFLDEQKIGRIGYVDLDRENPTVIKGVSAQPVLDIGQPGMFDEHGVNPVSIVQGKDQMRLYYQGWQRAKNVPYLLFTGMAISSDGGQTFKRYAQVPVLDRTTEEPFLRSCGMVIKDKNCWKIWYLCGKDWIETNTGIRPWYEIRHLQSTDGINWGEHGHTCLSPVGDDEFGFGRPYVTFNGSTYTLWSSLRRKSNGYRFICAESNDGKTWTRVDSKLDIDVSQNGWDAKMICFPAVINVDGRTYLFYNGNQYGETGFGAAELVD
jgi:hypothetical protein